MSVAFAPYLPPGAPAPRRPTAASLRTNRALAAVMWTLALATVVGSRYLLNWLM